MPETIIRGTKRFYEDRNADRPTTVVLVHGHPFDHTMWSYQLEALAAFRVITPDLRGYGRSATGSGDIFIEEQALDLALLLDQLSIETVHLVGLSMGGQIVVEFARLFPDRSLSLVVCDSNPGAETDESFTRRLQLADTIERIGMVKHTDETIANYLHPDTVAGKGEVYRHLYRMMTATTAEGAAASHRGRARRRNNLDFAERLAVPVLVVVGEKDAYTSVAESRAVAQKFPDAGFVIIAGAGHMPNMEQPAAFNEALLTFYHTRFPAPASAATEAPLQPSLGQ